MTTETNLVLSTGRDRSPLASNTSSCTDTIAVNSGPACDTRTEHLQLRYQSVSVTNLARRQKTATASLALCEYTKPCPWCTSNVLQSTSPIRTIVPDIASSFLCQQANDREIGGCEDAISLIQNEAEAAQKRRLLPTYLNTIYSVVSILILAAFPLATDLPGIGYWGIDLAIPIRQSNSRNRGPERS